MSEIATTSPAVFRNKTDLTKFVKNHDGASSDDLVKAINIKLQLSVSADNTGHHHRLDAGRMLLELRARVEAEGINDWWQWQKGKFDRSRKDMEKLMRLARAEDPEAAVEQERAQQTVRDRRKPGRGAGPAPSTPTSDIDTILYMVRALTDDQRAELFTKLKETYPWS